MEHLRGRRFRSDGEVKEMMKRFLNGLENRPQKCVEKDNYVTAISNDVNFYENKQCRLFVKLMGALFLDISYID